MVSEDRKQWAGASGTENHVQPHSLPGFTAKARKDTRAQISSGILPRLLPPEGAAAAARCPRRSRPLEDNGATCATYPKCPGL